MDLDAPRIQVLTAGRADPRCGKAERGSTGFAICAANVGGRSTAASRKPGREIIRPIHDPPAELAVDGPSPASRSFASVLADNPRRFAASSALTLKVVSREVV